LDHDSLRKHPAFSFARTSENRADKLVLEYFQPIAMSESDTGQWISEVFSRKGQHLLLVRVEKSAVAGAGDGDQEAQERRQLAPPPSLVS
jgi:hypothetical protein